MTEKLKLFKKLNCILFINIFIFSESRYLNLSYSMKNYKLSKLNEIRITLFNYSRFYFFPRKY